MRFPKRVLLIPALVLSASALLSWVLADRLVLPESYDDVVVWLRSHGDVAWLVGVAVIAADAFLPVPSTPALFAMGVIYGPALGGAICGTALTAAGMAGYGLVRALGERGARRLIGDDDLATTQRFYDRWGIPAIVLGRVVGGPAEWAVVFAALSNLPTPKVLGATAFGGYSAGFAFAALGAASVRHPLYAIAAALAIVLALAAAGRGMAKR